MFKSQLTKTQRDDMKINNDFEKRRDRLAQSHHGYKNKIKSIPDFEIEEYDCGILCFTGGKNLGKRLVKAAIPSTINK